MGSCLHRNEEQNYGPNDGVNYGAGCKIAGGLVPIKHHQSQ
jgi:hypothetical protein